MKAKEIVEVRRDVPAHWVGDGFPVRSLFSYAEDAAAVSPFLLLDYAGPAEFGPATGRRGVEVHPHRGFETVTIVYQGELEHRDSGGNSGVIGPGDVQWMTAASGLVHEEFHSRGFTERGGVLEMAQLWVNLPAAHKAAPPGYQEIPAAEIPTVALAGGAGTARVIAGEFEGVRGPARTFTPIDVRDVRLEPGATARLPTADGHAAILLVREGSVVLNGTTGARAVSLVILGRPGDGVEVRAEEAASILLLAGEPIDEPVVGRGPFVMNTEDEIRLAIRDYREGRMGNL